MNFDLNAYLMALNYPIYDNTSIDYLQQHFFYLSQYLHPNQYLNHPSNSQHYSNVNDCLKIQQTQSIQVPDTNKSQIKIQNTQNNQPPSSLDVDKIHNKVQKLQKDDRNLNSIVIRNFTNFVNSHPNITQIISQIIKKNHLTISLNEYKQQFLNIFPLGQSYVGIGKLKTFLKKKSDSSVITLILLRKFISVDYFTVIINSKKVAKSAKLKQLLHGKKLWTELVHKLN